MANSSTMTVTTNQLPLESSCNDWSGRWGHVSKVLERTGPFTAHDFQAGPELLEGVKACKILVIGAGGLGCELLKNLALMGFMNIEVIDMDTIELSNLNRQFLFREKDIGKSKAECAAAFINSRVPGCVVTAHHKKIQDYDADFYRTFNIVICGLDSVVARRWINGMLISLLEYEDGMLNQASIIPFIDGGTEGFKGNARVIVPGLTACIECTLDLFPPQVNFPLCTLANIPRLPEHCIEYVRVLEWPKEHPFGDKVAIDGDDPAHIQWIYEKSLERAQQFNIEGINYRLTQGVIKHIIPAVASTNAVIAASCATEAFKLATECASIMNNYMVFNNTEGLYTYTYEAERKEHCLACSNVPQEIIMTPTSKFQEIIDYLTGSTQFQMRSPGITTTFSDGRNRTLYMQTVEAIEKVTRANLSKTLEELDLCDGQELVVADITTPNALVFKLKIK